MSLKREQLVVGSTQQEFEAGCRPIEAEHRQRPDVGQSKFVSRRTYIFVEARKSSELLLLATCLVRRSILSDIAPAEAGLPTSPPISLRSRAPLMIRSSDVGEYAPLGLMIWLGLGLGLGLG